MEKNTQTQAKAAGHKPGVMQYLLLVLILVILPGISWFYLKYGLEYQIKVRSELHNYGKIEVFSFDGFNQDSLTGRLTLINFAKPEFHSTAAEGLAMSKLHHQFDQSPEIRFVSVVPLDSDVELKNWSDKNKAKDPSQWKVLGAQAQQISEWQSRLASQAKVAADNSSLLFVADPKGVLREVYNMLNEEEIKKLIQHIAMLAPRDSIVEVEMKPYTEK
ncbi:MAG: hypothetical protein ABIV51_03795 [Saprospiraceae bacterium]